MAGELGIVSSQAFLDGLAWLLVLTFLVTTIGASVLGWRERSPQLAAGAWAIFGLFWLVLSPHFLFVKHSVIEGVLSFLAVPMCLFVAAKLYRGQRSLLLPTKAVGVMGLIYLPFVAMPFGWNEPLERIAVEATVTAVGAVLALLNHPATLTLGDSGLMNTFAYVGPDGHPYEFSIILACTGIGTIAIFGGLILAVNADRRRQFKALAAVIPIVLGLNVLRLVFITMALHRQWFDWIPAGVLMGLFSYSDPRLTSFIVADKILAQSLSVVALVVITLGLLRILPEIVTVLDAIFEAIPGMDLRLEDALDESIPSTATVGPDASSVGEGGD